MRPLGDLLDLVAPPRCAACDEPFPHATPLCATCRDALLPPAETPDGVRAAFLHGGPIAAAIHRAKYGDDPRVAVVLGALLRDVLPRGIDLVAPIPLHPKRLRARGFNQAARLAEPVAAALGVPLARALLSRSRDTPSQTTLDRDRRAENVADAFAVRDPDAARGRSVLLVDDVCTTGATMRAAFAALRCAGAVEVRAVVLAAAALRSAGPASRGGGRSTQDPSSSS
jgi:ComF family protein